ncbi:hypothetical protein MMC11_001712 [Xylographa trunciseda]|nr:hypothetical protein [Xylographa trunciseda]
MRRYTRIFLVLIQLLNSFLLATSMPGDVPAAPFLSKFHRAMVRAESSMIGVDREIPVAFGSGGGCYRGYGDVSTHECRETLALMPSQNLNPNDIIQGPNGQLLTRDFERRDPMIWKGNNRCIIGVSLYEARLVKGLYPQFKEAASLIIEKCSGRGRGGVIRFAHFEVVVFDERVLPRHVPDYFNEFFRQSANIPLSRGLNRLWVQRSRQ